MTISHQLFILSKSVDNGRIQIPDLVIRGEIQKMTARLLQIPFIFYAETQKDFFGKTSSKKLGESLYNSGSQPVIRESQALPDYSSITPLKNPKVTHIQMVFVPLTVQAIVQLSPIMQTVRSDGYQCRLFRCWCVIALMHFAIL